MLNLVYYGINFKGIIIALVKKKKKIKVLYPSNIRFEERISSLCIINDIQGWRKFNYPSLFVLLVTVLLKQYREVIYVACLRKSSLFKSCVKKHFLNKND